MDKIAQHTDAESSGAQSVDRALSLLSLIARAGGAPVAISALVEKSELSRPTVRRMLLALMRAGLVEQDEVTRSYALGPESYVIGLMAGRRFNLLDVAMDSLMRLSAESGDTSFLSVRRGAYSVCLHREDGSFPIRTHALQAGERHPLGVGAGGMAILACLPGEEAEEVISDNTALLARDYPNFTPELLRQHIRETRERGWSLNPGLYLANSWAVGTALHAPDGQVLAALSIAALDIRMQPQRQRELAALLKRETRLVERRLARKLNFKNPGSP